MKTGISNRSMLIPVFIRAGIRVIRVPFFSRQSGILNPMRPIPIPLTDATLRLSLPFSGMPTGVRILLTLGVIFVFLVLLFLLYRHEMRLVPRRFAVAL